MIRCRFVLAGRKNFGTGMRELFRMQHLQRKSAARVVTEAEEGLRRRVAGARFSFSAPRDLSWRGHGDSRKLA